MGQHAPDEINNLFYVYKDDEKVENVISNIFVLAPPRAKGVRECAQK